MAAFRSSGLSFPRTFQKLLRPQIHTNTLALLREIQRLWEQDGKSDARLIGESLGDSCTDADLKPEAAPAVLWDDGMVWLKCSPPRIRPSAEAVANQCPRLSGLASLLLRDELFQALPWQSQAVLSEDFGSIMDCKKKSAMLIGDPALGAFQQSTEINVGILYIDHGAESPEHCHYAEEIYQFISGSSFWFHGS